MATRGDDLDDDFIDEGFVAGSDVDEDGDHVRVFAPLEGEEDQFVAGDDDVLYTPEAGTSAKRKSTAVENADASAAKSGVSSTTDEAKRDKKRKKRAKDNERKAKVCHTSFTAAPNQSSHLVGLSYLGYFLEYRNSA